MFPHAKSFGVSVFLFLLMRHMKEMHRNSESHFDRNELTFHVISPTV